MIDPFAGVVNGVVAHRWTGVPLAALAGVAGSVGPCVAPRYLALAALVGDRRPFAPIAAFALGIIVVTVALGAGVGVLGALLANVAPVDTLVAGALVAFGTAAILREPHCCERDAPARAPRASGAFALGAASALVVSPCCTPVIVAVAGLGAFDRDPLFAAAYLAAFALGHAVPLLFAGLTGVSLAGRARAFASTAAPSVVCGTLTIALGCYYGLLA